MVVNTKLHLSALVLTIALTRIALWLIWDGTLMATAKADNWHHAYTGGLLIVSSVLLFKRYNKLKAILSGVGLGLVIDEATVPLCWMGAPVDYWSIKSWGTAWILVVWYASLVKTRGRFSILYL